MEILKWNWRDKFNSTETVIAFGSTRKGTLECNPHAFYSMPQKSGFPKFIKVNILIEWWKNFNFPCLVATLDRITVTNRWFDAVSSFSLFFCELFVQQASYRLGQCTMCLSLEIIFGRCRVKQLNRHIRCTFPMLLYQISKPCFGWLVSDVALRRVFCEFVQTG